MFRTEKLLGGNDSFSGLHDEEEAWDKGVEGGRSARVKEGEAEGSCCAKDELSFNSLARELKVDSGRTSKSSSTSIFGA